MSSFNPLRPRSFSSYVAELKQTMSIGAFRTKDEKRLYIAEEGKANVVLCMMGEGIQKKSDITAETMVAYFLNSAGEEVLVAYNPGGKDAEFSL
jgi:hypothetical protein